ncbi:MAG: ATP-binding protein [Mycobacterium sp.]|nr:ATP-binding protein [Mycobacterium sp.]
MISPRRSYQQSEAVRFARNGLVADGSTAASIREELVGWIRRHLDLSETRTCDVLLAVNEALANAAEFAYLDLDPADDAFGTVDLDVAHDPRRSALMVTVADHGRWRQPDERYSKLSRGRGIPLMHVLADAAIIDVSLSGTTVRLRFDGVCPKVL